MKLSSALLEITLSQFEAQAIPDNHPAVPQLNSLFGDHTFFIDADGLSIVEPTEAAGARTATVIRLAAWKDANRTSLMPHEPQATGVLVLLGPDDPDTAA